MLDESLDSRLTYHNRQHTEDVMKQAERIALSEKMNDPRCLLLLQIAALFHDTGFLETYANHEERSCEILIRHLANEEMEAGETDCIVKMILATKAPQLPHSPSERVLCDADLDYLGREDFFKISESLKHEFLSYHVVKDETEWSERQIHFLEQHSYFTDSSRTERTPVKTKHIQTLSGQRLNRNH
jgi:hypothetical protein